MNFDLVCFVLDFDVFFYMANCRPELNNMGNGETAFCTAMMIEVTGHSAFDAWSSCPWDDQDDQDDHDLNV